MAYGPTSTTISWDAILSTTLNNVKDVLYDNISSATPFMFAIKKAGGWEKVANLGAKCQFDLMYGLTQAQVYGGLSTLAVGETQGITAAFAEWRQAAAPIAISRIDMRKNSGEFQIIDLLKSRTKQAMLGLSEAFNKWFLRGNRNDTDTAGNLYDPYTDGTYYFCDPLCALVSKLPTTTPATLASIDVTTNTWYANRFTQSSATTWAMFLKELLHLNNLASYGPGGAPDLHICDQGTLEIYTTALWDKTRLTNDMITTADFPFPHLLFNGQPVVFDLMVPDSYTGVNTITKGTWFGLNCQFLNIKVDSQTDFVAMPFVKAVNLDGQVAQVLCYLSAATTNRRKQFMLNDIVQTIAA